MTAGTEGLGRREVHIPLPAVQLEGFLDIPQGAGGLVVFVHGSGSSRFSSRNNFVAGNLRDRGLATLLFDLLSADEERIDQFTAELRFDIELLSERVRGVTSWLRAQEETRDMVFGYFGASTGAAAALVAAAQIPETGAVVSRGGRPDLADRFLPEVKAPTLLIVGGEDDLVIQLNRRALALLPGTKEMRIVPGASHLFEEPGTLEEAARLAGDWFARYLTRASQPGPPGGS